MTKIHHKNKVKSSLSFNQYYKKYFPLFAFFILLLIGGIFINPKMIKAQIASLYNKKSDEIASINALMSAVTSHDVEGVKFFVKAGDSLINQKNFGGATALHLAAREKDFAIAQILIANKADVNVVDNEGWTPLMRASLAGQADIVNLLLDAGAKADTLNSFGESAIYQAAISGCNECLAAIFAKVNLIRIMDLNILKIQLRESYMVAQAHDNEAAQAMLSNYLDQAVRMGAVINNVNTEVETQKDGLVDITDKNKTNNKPSNITVQKPAKVFNFNSSKTGKVTKYVADDKKVDTAKNVTIPVDQPVKQDIALPAKKFAIKKAESSQTSTPSIQDSKNIKAESSNLDISLNDNETESNSVAASPNSDGQSKKFKFTQGPKGKKLKPKPKIVAVSPVATPVTPLAPTAPAVVPNNNAPVTNLAPTNPTPTAPTPVLPTVPAVKTPSLQNQKDDVPAKISNNTQSKSSDLTMVAMKQDDVVEGGKNRAPAAAFALSTTSLK